MGYSIDSSSNTTIVNGGVLNGQVNAASGAHTLHVKAWGNQGASCNVDIPVNVSVAPPSTPTAPSLPATDVSVSQPLGGASVASPFTVSASGTQCKSQPISAMGYSLDNSSNTVVVNGKTVGAKVSAAAGSHVLHIKAWGANGASCVNDVPVTVTAGAPTSPTTPAKSGPSIPEDAVATKLIQNLPTWKSAHDEGTPGTSTGTTNLATTPSQSGSARQFATSYTNYGGHRYHVSLNPDANSTNFVFDAQVYIAGSAKDISNVEMDLNQVLPNGQTVIYGFQCDAWSNTWDYTANTGTPTSPNDQWLHSNQACNARNWTPNAWHHVQIQYSRDSSGNVTYQSVWLDGVKQDLNVTVNSAFALGWGPALLINFQIDGYNSTSGSSNVYLDNVTLYSW
jgi:hypothetical protein